MGNGISEALKIGPLLAWPALGHNSLAQRQASIKRKKKQYKSHKAPDLGLGVCSVVRPH